MSRKRTASKRPLIPDPKYKNGVVTKFIQRMMWDGKKALSRRIMYDALDQLAKKTNQQPLEAYLAALENVKPVVEVKSRRVGGSTYQVPVEIREERREALAMRWIINAARARSGKPMAKILGEEFADAYNSTGSAFKKKEDTHRMAEANKAFAHYRW